MTVTLSTPETAPRDGTVILGHFGYPWLMAATWNEVTDQWAVAELQADLYDGQWNDRYFATEYLPPKDLLGWLPMPELPE